MDFFCDHTDPKVVTLSLALQATTSSKQDYAIAAFNWVRDNISYRVLYNWSVPVSYTLKNRYGNCGTKACLLVALLRAAGIEAAFCVERIDTSGTFFFVPTSITSMCNDKSIHFSAAVKLNDQWLHIDATTDSVLAKGMSGVAGAAFQITFDGKSHAVAGGHEGFEDGVERIHSIESYMSKKSRVSPQVRECFNLSADFCRAVGVHYKTAAAISQASEDYIFAHYKPVIQAALPFLAAAQQAKNAVKSVATTHGASPTNRTHLSTLAAYRSSQ